MARKTPKAQNPKTETTPDEKSIGGKLGVIVSAITVPQGATLQELSKVTNWQPHTVRAALSRLRKRGYDISLEDVDNRKAYRANRQDA